MAYNTILIRRRLPGGAAGAPAALSGGELAFNEVDSTLYYGSSAGVISIAGAGAYVDRTTNQSIFGDKTFNGTTTLSSTTFSANSDIDAGSNKITNLAEPDSNSDAATKFYVDNVASGASSSTTALSTEIYTNFVKLVDDRYVDLSGGLTVTSGITADTFNATSDASVGGNLTVTGNLSVLGTQTVINTQTINISGISTQIDVVNNGTATGITVNQNGNQDVAEFKDDGVTALIIKDGGNVGIGTSTPNEKLTVSGSISATEDIFARNGTFSGTLGVGSSATFASTVSAVGAVTFDSTLYVAQNSTFFADVSGQAGVSKLVDFIVDGGVF